MSDLRSILRITRMEEQMERIAYRVSLVAALLVLVSSCSLEGSDKEEGPDKEDLWAGRWVYEGEQSRREAMLLRNGNQLSGSFMTEYWEQGAEPWVVHYWIEATIDDSTADGVAIDSNNRRAPVTIQREEEGIRFLGLWNSMPLLRRQE